MKNEQLHYILFRLFWDDKPVGFEYWSGEFTKGYSYTYGEPDRIDGHVGYGWCGKEISHNRKEIIDIKYVDEEYLINQKKFNGAMKEIFDNIEANKDIINLVRETNGLEPIYTN